MTVTLPPLPPIDEPREHGPRRAFIYARRSYDPHQSARSIRDQSTEGRRVCERGGWTVAGVFEDPDNSASRHSHKNRPDYDAMVKAVEAGQCDVIVAWESVRLSRDITVFTRLADLCERNGVLLCLNGTVYDMANSQQRFFAQMTVLQGSYEADTTRDRNVRTMGALARDGRPTGIVPYGFAREYDPRSGALLRQVPHPHQAAVVAELTRAVASGRTLMSLARQMRERGEPGPDPDADWTGMTVRALVKRPANIGKRVHRGAVIGDAAWPAIVEQEDYYAAMRVLSDPSRVTRRDTAVKYLMSGLALCGAVTVPQVPCSTPLRPHTVSGRMAYTCPACWGASMRVETLDDLVAAALLAYVERREFAGSLLAPMDAPDGVRDLMARIAEWEAQLAQARRLGVTVLPSGRLGMSAAMVSQYEVTLLPLIDRARRQVLEASVPAAVRMLAQGDAREVWGRFDLAQRREAVRGLVRVTVNRAGAGVRTVKPGRVTFEWLR